jgi:hypothetical protein
VPRSQGGGSTHQFDFFDGIVALIYDPSVDDERSHLVVGIEADGDITNVTGEAGAVAADIMTQANRWISSR